MNEPSLLEAWTDNTIIPFGKFKGTSLNEVESKYLLWCYDQESLMKQYPGLEAYIASAHDLLEEDAYG